MNYKYTIIRSGRKTLAMEISPDLKIIIRAPYGCSIRYIENFVSKHEKWIDKNMEIQRRRAETRLVVTEQEKSALIMRAKEEIPPIVSRYANIMGLKPAGVKITGAQKRFGSCSSKNRLCFSYRLMLYPEEAVEYVVVHELAHIVHRNHSRDFYALVESVLPDYKRRDAMLKG